MPSALFLAATAAEIQAMQEISANIGWMACHFSAYGTGLSNLPGFLPEGSLLILNDRTPVCGHDPQRIAEEMTHLVQTYRCSRVLLDLQRPGEAESMRIVSAVTKTLPCPVGISAPYALDPAFPVFLPPVPLHKRAEDYLRPWQGRPVWLEVSLEAAVYVVTAQGCHIRQEQPMGQYPHQDEALCCRYHTMCCRNAIEFHLHRTAADLPAFLQQAAQAECFIGLYQELAQAAAHCTAFFH